MRDDDESLVTPRNAKPIWPLAPSTRINCIFITTACNHLQKQKQASEALHLEKLSSLGVGSFIGYDSQAWGRLNRASASVV
jgi:hypothetical protein